MNRFLLPTIALASAVTLSAVTDVRVATFNTSLNRDSDGQLATDLSTSDNAQAQDVAAIIQEIRPDIILINEFDYPNTGDPYSNVDAFASNYLGLGQGGRDPISFAYSFTAPSNTGVQSGLDFDGNNRVGGPADAFGFGFFPGQFGMALYSKYPIVTDQIRTFQTFRWIDMPGALLPDDPFSPGAADYYSAETLEVFRLSSKSHWDIPINVNGQIVHILASHPTPPVFDGAEDRNGRRNHDEIRFWADYIDPEAADYIYDDEGNVGGLADGSPFLILGDLNADPFDGDSTSDAILQLLNNPRIDTSFTPSSLGGVEAAAADSAVHSGDPAFDTADFGSTTGNLRVDYVLPSNVGLEVTGGGVFWPESTDPVLDDLSFGSDHRAVYVDVEVIPEPSQIALILVGGAVLIFLGGRRR